MTITTMIFWIVITWIYGYIMYRRGQTKGAIDLVEMQFEAGVITDKLKMYQRLASYYNSKDNDEG